MSLWHWNDNIVLLGASIDDILVMSVYVVCDVLHVSRLRSQMFLTLDAQTDVIELRVRVDGTKINYMHVYICNVTCNVQYM